MFPSSPSWTFEALVPVLVEIADVLVFVLAIMFDKQMPRMGSTHWVPGMSEP